MKVKCLKCGGSGVYLHYGQCYRCGGSGLDPRQPSKPRKRYAKAIVRVAGKSGYEVRCRPETAGYMADRTQHDHNDAWVWISYPDGTIERLPPVACR
jgi:hypothetical protein